jgi:multiple sugar transport system substrate-binding protein
MSTCARSQPVPRYGLRALRLATILAVAITAAACARLPSFLTEPPVVIRAIAFDPSRQAYMNERAREFERLNEGIKVEVMPQMSAVRGNVTSALSAFQTGMTPIDVVALTDQDFGGLTDFDLLIELSAFIRETTDLQPGDFFPTALPAFQHRGRQMMMPAEMIPMMIFYNRDLFDAAKAQPPGPGWNMQDFAVAARKLSETQANKQPAVGFVSDPLSAAWPFVLAHGGRLPDPIGDPTLDALAMPDTARGLQWFVDLGLKDKVTPLPLSSRNLGLWFNGRAGMVALPMNARNVTPTQGGPNATPTPGPRQGWGFRWDVATIPRDKERATTMNVVGYGIIRGTKYPNQAWAFVRHLVKTLPPSGSGNAYVPAMRALTQSEEYAALYPESGRQAYVDSVQVAYALPVLPASARVAEGDFTGVFNGDKSASESLQRVRERLQPLIRKWLEQNPQ